MPNIIVVAPHADDEILGCGGVIAKHVNDGNNVYVIIATNGNNGAPELFSMDQVEATKKEAVLSHKLLGIKETIFLDFPAPALNSYPQYKIALAFKSVFDKYKPKTIYIPHPGDLHLDHAAVYRASLVAARPIGDYSIDLILCYETLSETEWTPGSDRSFVPNYFVDISEYIDLKLLAMQQYKSQLRDYPSSRSLKALEALSMLRGSTIEHDNAEAFFVERQIIRS